MKKTLLVAIFVIIGVVAPLSAGGPRFSFSLNLGTVVSAMCARPCCPCPPPVVEQHIYVPHYPCYQERVIVRPYYPACPVVQERVIQERVIVQPHGPCCCH